MLKLNSETIALRHTFGAPISTDLVMAKVLLRRKSKLLIISTTNGICVKMRYPLADHQKELDIFNAMGKLARSCFVPILTAFEFESRDGKTWGGLCMPFIDTTLCRIMPSSPALDALAVRFSAYEPREGEAELCGSKLELCGSNFMASVLSACFKLLQTLHKCGWVHGDTHMGNFMLDSKTWRVFLIDTERSFLSRDPVQHLLDAQELAGHATGLLLSLHDKSQWDMDDVWPVSSKLQSSTLGGLANFVPVCSCFAFQDTLERLRGCPMCHSEANLRKAALYTTEGHHWTHPASVAQLGELSSQIAEKRQDCHCELRELGKQMQPHLPVIKSFLKNDMSNMKCKRVMLRALSDYNLKKWLKLTLYRGSIVKGGARQAKRFVTVLRACGLRELAVSFKDLICE